MAKASVTVTAWKAIRDLRKLGQRLDNPRPALKRIGKYVEGLAQQAFRDGRDPATHAPWKPLAASTLRQRRGTSAQILVDTSELKNSIHSLITGKKVMIGTGLVRGRAHQLGRKVPKRSFLGIDSQGYAEIKRIISRYILEGRA